MRKNWICLYFLLFLSGCGKTSTLIGVNTQTALIENLERFSQPEFIPLSQLDPDNGVAIFSMRRTEYWMICAISITSISEMCINYDDGNNYIMPSISPNGRYIFALRERDNVTNIVIINSENANIEYSSPMEIRNSTWSSDGKELLYSYEENGNTFLEIVEVEKEYYTHRILLENISKIITIDWNNEGILVIAYENNSYYIYNIVIDNKKEKVENIEEIFTASEKIYNLKISRDNSRIAIIYENKIDIIQSANKITTLIDGTTVSGNIDWSMDDNNIAFTEKRNPNEYVICIVKISNNKKKCLEYEDEILFQRMPLWTKDGELIYLQRRYENNMFVEKINLEEGKYSQISGAFGYKDWLFYYYK